MLPEAFLERMHRMLGDEYEAFMESFEHKKYQALRLNGLKVRMDGSCAADLICKGDAAEVTETSFAHLRKVPWAENGYYYEAEDQPGKHPFHEAGVYYIQEPSAMAPVELLGVCPGERVADLCAAPGGKSTQIAAKLLGEGFLLCNEIHPARAKILSENVERMGIGNACVTNETPARLAEFFPEYFDKVLVDAPCSGEGMFRKNEAACEEWSPENVELCATRQDEILDCAARMLRPGGRIVYSTCTFAPAENEGSISRFLDRHPEFDIMPIHKASLGLEGGNGNPQWGDAANQYEELKDTLRLWPHRVCGEGHYAAVLIKAGNIPEGYRNPAVNGTAKPVSEKELGAFFDFCKENLRLQDTKAANILASIARGAGLKGQFQFITFGDNLYMVSADMPSVKGLKVLRPGLHLGELKKNRFEPSHALALAWNPSRALHVWNMDLREDTVRMYLSGQTFPAQGEKGWYLICVDGYSMGWGKLAGGMMKNHYPKGLRK